MIPRYTPKDFDELWSPLSKYQAWFDVELEACRAMEQAGFVPSGTADKLAPLRDNLNPARIDAIEEITRHDVIAFLTHVEELGGESARWLHRGMTSSDVLDTSLALLLVEAADRIHVRLDVLLKAFRVRIEEHRHTPAMGRSHGISAEPVTFGLILAGHFAELTRARQRLRDARREIAVGKIAGAVGTYAHLSPTIEEKALASLGLKPERVATQVVARDRHAMYVTALAAIAAAIERFALNVRHWQRTELGEAEEHFKKGQKGSSAMPHKRNPVLSENLCGLARVVRAALVPAFENVGLWHERDISHSSVERMLLPDVTATVAFMLDRATSLVKDLVVYPEHLLSNLKKAGGLWASEGVLLALVNKGIARQQAYEWVQRNAMRAFAGEGAFQEFLCRDPEIMRQLSAEAVAEQFDLNHALAHVDTIIDRALDAEHKEQT